MPPKRVKQVKVVFSPEEAKALLEAVWTMSVPVKTYTEITSAIGKLRDAIDAGA